MLAIDWQSLGVGPVGTDLGLLMASAREAPEPLLDAYLLGLADGGSEEVATADEVRLGARVVAAYTVVSRAEWALARVATGEGALAAKFRHPSVAPYLRALERRGRRDRGPGPALISWSVGTTTRVAGQRGRSGGRHVAERATPCGPGGSSAPRSLNGRSTM